MHQLRNVTFPFVVSAFKKTYTRKQAGMQDKNYKSRILKSLSLLSSTLTCHEGHRRYVLSKV